MPECMVCEHAKVKAINAALDSGRSPNLVRAQYRLEPQMLDAHIAHRAASRQKKPLLQDMHYDGNHLPIQSLRSSDADIGEVECRCYWCQMSGYQRLLQAWNDAAQQEKERFCAHTRTMDVPF